MPESNQTKRIETEWELTGCSPQSSNMPRDKHVSTFAPLSAPKFNRRRESVPKSHQKKRNGVGTHVLLPRARSTCQGTNTSVLWPR